MGVRTDQREQLLRSWIADLVMVATQAQQNPEPYEAMVAQLLAVGAPLDGLLERQRGALAEKIQRDLLNNSKQRKQLLDLQKEFGSVAPATNRKARRTAKKASKRAEPKVPGTK
jgi:hypothetical protein